MSLMNGPRMLEVPIHPKDLLEFIKRAESFTAVAKEALDNHFPRKRAEIEEARRVAEAHRRYDSHNIDENSFDQLKDTVDGCNRILKALEEHRDKWVELKFLCEFVGVQLNRFNSDSLVSSQGHDKIALKIGAAKKIWDSISEWAKEYINNEDEARSIGILHFCYISIADIIHGDQDKAERYEEVDEMMFWLCHDNKQGEGVYYNTPSEREEEFAEEHAWERMGSSYT